MNGSVRDILVLALLAGSIAFAQVSTGTLSGSVTDPSGAAIPGATIRIRGQDTGASTSWTSNEIGFYKAPFLRPGLYSVRVEAKGFQSWEAEAMEVQVGKETVADVRLALGEVAESLTVNAASTPVESTTAQASVHFGAQKILHLPRVSAGLDRLALLAPGVAPTGGNVAENGAVFSANGQRPRSNGFLLDGQDNSHRIPTGPRFLFNVLEAVSEFHVITNQFSAEYGLAQGSVVNVTTRGGTNQFHGILNWLHRNDAHLAALTNFQRRAGNTTPPKLIENRYGATLGGPIRKDRLFFFAYLDKQTIRQDSRLEAGPAALTPTAEGLRALGEAFPNSNTVGALLRHGPLTQPVGNPEFLAGSRTLATVSSPAGNPVSIEMGRLVRYLKGPTDIYQVGGRADLDANPRNRVSGRYLDRGFEVQNTTGTTALAGYPTRRNVPMRSAAVTWSRIVSPTFVNEARFGYDYDVNEISDANATPFEQLGRNIAEFNGPSGYLGFGLPNNIPQISRHHSLQVADNVSHYRGRHAWKYGFQASRLWAYAGTRAFYNGQFVFNTLQNFVDNRPVAFNGVDGPLATRYGFTDQSYFFQDDFRARSDLTLNLGLRYEVPSNFTRFASNITVPRELDPRTAIWNTALPIEARTSTAPARDFNNWAPRIGFAWSPRSAPWLLGDQRTVIRGGYGISYDFLYGLLGGHVLPSAPLVFRYGLSGDAARVPAEVTGDAVRRAMQPPAGQDPRQLPSAQFAPDLHSPMLHSWSLGVQRRLGISHTLEVRYAGNRGIGLLQSRNANPNVQGYLDAGFPQVVPSGVRPGVNPACAVCTGRVDARYGTFTELANTASSTYHALQTRYEGQLRRQLVAGVSYTFGRALDNVSDGDLRSGVLPQNPFDITSGERGPSTFDLPHVLALNLVWEVPALGAKEGLSNRLFGGWTMVGIIRISSGAPATPQQRNFDSLGNDPAFSQAFGLNADTRRPFSSNPSAPIHTVGLVQADGSLVDFQRRSPVTPDAVRWIYNNNAAARLLGTPFGAGRNVLRAPSVFVTDLSLFKSVRLSSRITWELRVEAENAFNHPNLGIGGLAADLAGFLNPTETQAAPRRVAAGMRLLF